ncbi:MAG: hypothetical protein JXM72_09380, partial [Deltaproteobacteria bacterium]|nr:hypothetical protein [Deltaproteobacteria bacterium]
LSQAYAFGISINENGEIVQKSGQGEINWSKGVISAVGYADINQPVYAQQVAAAADARANLVMMLGEIHISRGIKVQKGILEEDINQQTVQGILSGSFVGEMTRASNGMASVIAYKKMSPDIMKELLPEKYFSIESGETVYSPAIEAVQVSAQAPAVTPYTGLIIDAKGLDVTPSLGLNVMVEDSREILYGMSTCERQEVIKKGGMAGYASSVEKAKENRRIGNNPMIIQAVEAAGERNTDLSVSKNDAAKIYQENLQGSFLKDLKVVVVCGSNR